MTFMDRGTAPSPCRFLIMEKLDRLEVLIRVASKMRAQAGQTPQPEDRQMMTRAADSLELEAIMLLESDMKFADGSILRPSHH
jgi:hypothetical protein